MNTIFSNNLKKLRQQKNYTQEQVAELLGVSTHTVSRWECNTTCPDIMLLPEIARLYCVTVDDLFKEDSVAYENYAQRLASVFETTREPEDYICAVSEFEKLAKTHSLTTNDMWTCGVIHQIMMDDCRQKADTWFDKVLTMGKEADAFVYWRTRMQKMKLFAQTGKQDENIETQRRIIKDKVDDAKEWSLLLAAYMFANRYEEGYEWFLKAVSLFPDESEVYIHGGDICKKLKRYQDAFAFWDKAEEIGTVFFDGLYAKAICYEDIGEYNKAYETWNTISEELRKRGYDIESADAEKHAKTCLKRIK